MREPDAKENKRAIRSFRELIVWKRGLELAEEVYRITSTLPITEKFGLVSQMQRCAVSIPSNIAEGRQRGTRKDFLQFLRIADGSAAELETQMLLAQKIFRLKHGDKAFALLSEVQRMLGAMIRKL